MYKIDFSKSFIKEFKILSKKYSSIKYDIDWLMDILEEDWPTWTTLWNNVFKIRLKNSNNNKGKSAWYRVITLSFKSEKIVFLSIYSKNDIESISKEQIIGLIDLYKNNG